MVILNQNNKVVESPNLEAGYLINEKIPVTITWIVDVPAIKESFVKKQYANGGKDIGIRVVQAEEGHWEITDSNGDIVEHFDREIPAGIPHGYPVPDVWHFQRYIPYTAEELEQREAERLEAEANKVKAEEREVMLDELPDTLASTDDAICELFEMILEANNGNS